MSLLLSGAALALVSSYIHSSHVFFLARKELYKAGDSSIKVQTHRLKIGDASGKALSMRLSIYYTPS